MLTLINPITNVKIHLPFLPFPEDKKFPNIGYWSGAMSAPPSDPNCSILLVSSMKKMRTFTQWTTVISAGLIWTSPYQQSRCLIRTSRDPLLSFLVAVSTASPNAICSTSSILLSLILQLLSWKWTPPNFHDSNGTTSWWMSMERFCWSWCRSNLETVSQTSWGSKCFGLIFLK